MPAPSHFRILVGCFIGVCVVAPASSQQSAAPDPHAQQQPAAQEAPVVRVTTRLIQLNVLVQDSKGRPITGLTRQDFTLTDENAPQNIAIFSVRATKASEASRPPLPPNTFSNRIEQVGGVPSSVTVILLDGLNTRVHDMAYAREQVKRFFSQLRPEDRVAIYLLGRSSVRILHNFTSDASSLLRVLQQARPDAVPDAGDSRFFFEDWLQEAGQFGGYYNVERATNTLRALKDIANHLARIPGRKNLVWVSAGFPITFDENARPGRPSSTLDRRTFSSEIYEATRAINDANVAVYPVDARGLAGPTYTGPMTMPRGAPGAYTSSAMWPSLSTMQEMAARTGGKAFYNRNDINQGIRVAIDDSQVTYTLAYYPTHGKWDGEFRDIKVKVSRPGVRVRHRRGYFAAADAPVSAEESQEILAATASSPLEATAIGLTAAVTPIEVAGARAAKIDVRIQAAEIILVRDAGRWQGGIDVLFVQQRPDGSRLQSWNHGVNLNLQKDSYEEAMSQGFKFARTVDLLPETYQLRVVVRDATNGALGSVIIPVRSLFAAK